MKTRRFPVFAAGLSAAILLFSAVGSLHAQVDVKFERERMKIILRNIAGIIEKDFYDPQLRGLNWKALVKETSDNIDQANSPNTMVTAIFTMVNRLDDSHTVFLPPARAVRIRFGMEMKAFGDEIRIYELDKKGRAAAAGLQVGDRILGVNGVKAERATFDMVMLFFRRLQPVTALDLVYARGNEPPRRLLLEAHVANEPILEDMTKLDTIYKYIREAQKEKDEFEYKSFDGGVGYVRLPVFSGSEAFLDRVMNRFKDARAAIVDLRGNPGGSVRALSQLIGYFESKEVLIASLKRRDRAESLNAKPQNPHVAGPLFILVDSQSSSASEMFARHFQRTGHAQVIGDRTSGRVTASLIQARQIGADVVVPYGVQVAVARVVFPDGQELEKVGVTPDVACIPSEEQLRKEDDVCLSRARAMARKALGLEGAEVSVEIKP